jgi:hypothetical protein
MPAPSVFALVLSLLAAGCAVYCVKLVREGLPQNLMSGLKNTQGSLDLVHQAIDGQNGRLTAWRQEMEALYESVETTLEAVEKKRRSTAASASRIAAANGQEEGGSDIESIRRQARSQGFEV